MKHLSDEQLLARIKQLNSPGYVNAAGKVGMQSEKLRAVLAMG